jgi:hypothetical protein
MLKKTTVAVLGLAASGFAFAGTMGSVCAPGNVTVPCEAQHWSLGLQALYLKTTEGAVRGVRQLFASNAFAEINNDWNWGYKAEGAYQFNTGNDIAVSLMHLSTTADQDGFGFTIFGLGLKPYVAANQTHFDQVNVVLGQHLDLSISNKMRIYGGLQYANIQANATHYFALAGTVPVTYTSFNFFDNSNFRGVGPKIGVDYSYDLPGGLSLVANGASSLLYGTSRLSKGLVYIPSNLVVSATYASRKAIVPAFEGKLGLNYGYSLAQGLINLEGGYQAVDYYDVLQTSSTTAVSSSNFGLYGPYVGLKYVG